MSFPVMARVGFLISQSLVNIWPANLHMKANDKNWDHSNSIWNMCHPLLLLLSLVWTALFPNQESSCYHWCIIVYHRSSLRVHLSSVTVTYDSSCQFGHQNSHVCFFVVPVGLLRLPTCRSPEPPPRQTSKGSNHATCITCERYATPSLPWAPLAASRSSPSLQNGRVVLPLSSRPCLQLTCVSCSHPTTGVRLYGLLVLLSSLCHASCRHSAGPPSPPTFAANCVYVRSC